MASSTGSWARSPATVVASRTAIPAATIEVNAKLLHPIDQKVVASRTFLVKQPASSTAIADVAAAFDPALGEMARQLAGWVLTSGDGNERGTH